MNRGYAFGFLIIILVLLLGLYVAYTGFISTRDTIRARPTSPVRAEEAQVVAEGPGPTEVLTATGALTVTAAPAVTGTATGATGTGITASVPATELPVPAATEPVAILVTEPVVTATVPLEPLTPVPNSPPPTPVLQPAQPFRLAGPPQADPTYPICCYIIGTVRDAAGNGLEGVQVQALNEWTTLPPATTKGGTDLGKYDIPISTEVTNWEVMLVDGTGKPISTRVQIQFDAQAAQGYRVDWQRTY
jgi:hypothetical protein